VAIDDPHLHLLAYSVHEGHVDRVRLASIMHKEAPRDATAWNFSQGILRATAPVHLPANKDLGMDPRLCVPIRSGAKLHGFLWLFDSPPLTDGEVDAATEAGQAAAVAIERSSLIQDLERAREGELFRDLLSEKAEIRRHAAQELLETGMLVSTLPVVVMCVKPTRAGDGALDESTRLALAQGVDRLWKFVTPRHSLRLLRPDHGVVLVATKDPMLRPGGIEGLAANLASCVAALLPAAEEWRVVIGIGDPTQERSEALTSYTEAQAAVRLAQVVPSYGPVVSWSSIGVYRTLMTLTAGEVVREALHPGLVQLFRHPESISLVKTLELYFDLAGNAPMAADALGIHRATFYYRLHRIERITGLNLQSGDDRLALHLGLKLARLAGVHPLFVSHENGNGRSSNGNGAHPLRKLTAR
jgi:hypothetical protein